MLWVTNTMVYKRLSSWHSSSMCCVPAGSSDAVGSSSSRDRKSTRLNSSHSQISYAVFCLKKKKSQSQMMLGGPAHDFVILLYVSLGSFPGDGVHCLRAAFLLSCGAQHVIVTSLLPPGRRH